MKHTFVILLLSLLAACKQNEKRNNTTPAAFQQEDVVSSIKSYRSSDVVENMYLEIMEHDQTLDKLDDDIKNLLNDGRDSLNDYSKFHANCLDYYASAESKVARLGDSVLAKRIAELLTLSKARFEQQVNAHERIKQHIDTVLAEDLEQAYTVLKIIKTLPVLEKYSKENMPPIHPLQGLQAEYQKMIDRVERSTK